MKLEIQNYQSKEVTIVQMENKNPLAVALENTKLRDYPEETRNANTIKMVLWLLDLLGVKGDESTSSHHIVSSNFINDALKNYTYQEIKLAFQKYVTGEYYDTNGKPMLVTQQLNAVVIGRVMREYEEIKKRELDLYRRKRNEQLTKPKEMTEEEKELIVFVGVTDCFAFYKHNKMIEAGKGWVYDYFFEKKRLPTHTKEFKEEIKQRALVTVKEDIKKNGISLQVSEALKSINPATVAVKCKELILMDYFERLVKENIDIKTEMK